MKRDFGTGAITQRGKDRYLLRWSVGKDPITGKYIRKATTFHGTLTEARRELGKLTALRRNDSRITVGILLDTIIPLLPVTDGTRDDYRYALKHLPDATRQLVAIDVNPAVAGAVLRAVSSTAGPQSVRKMRTALMACWRFARSSGWLDGNPWAGHRLPAVPVSSGRALNQGELERLLEAVEPGLETVWIRLALVTGARPGEYLSVRWCDINEDVLTLWGSKTGKTREIPLDRATLEMIWDWQHQQRKRSLAAGGGFAATPYLISNDPTCEVPWTTNYAGQFRWRRLRARAGLPDRIRLYDLRHTTVTTMQADGHEPATVAGLAGHSAAMTLRTYTHSDRERQRAAVASMAARLDRRQA